MERPRTEIDETVRRRERRRLDPFAAGDAARGRRTVALRWMVVRPVRRALVALWRGFTAHAEPVPRRRTGRVAP